VCAQRRIFLSRLIRAAVRCTGRPERDLNIMETSNTQKKGKDMSIWIILAVIALWILLQGYILPKMGIST
jgi:hypothetical protein